MVVLLSLFTSCGFAIVRRALYVWLQAVSKMLVLFLIFKRRKPISKIHTGAICTDLEQRKIIYASVFVHIVIQ